MMIETELRQYVKDNISSIIDIQWVEPGRYGSTIGAADCILRYYEIAIALELKIWERTRNGIKCEMRPVQRRFHHMLMKKGGRSAVLFNIKGTNDVYLLRGDHTPLRNYASDVNSGCARGQLRHVLVLDTLLEQLLFDDRCEFWSKERKDAPTSL